MRAGRWLDEPAIDDAQRAALAYAEQVTRTPPAVTDECFARLRDCFSTPQIVELAAIAAWENYRARFNCGLGVEGHTFYRAGAAAGD